MQAELRCIEQGRRGRECLGHGCAGAHKLKDNDGITKSAELLKKELDYGLETVRPHGSEQKPASSLSTKSSLDLKGSIRRIGAKKLRDR